VILVETIFIDGAPVGVIRKDDYSGQVAFTPHKPPSKLPVKEWGDIDHLKEAVIAAYEQDHG